MATATRRRVMETFDNAKRRVMEQAGTGRVPIESFYKSALDGNWQFSESIECLQDVGALDDVDSSRMSVIIPNYMMIVMVIVMMVIVMVRWHS